MTTSTTFAAGTVVSSAWLNTVNDNLYDYKVNVKDFGAVGDGTTDDIAAFEAAIASFTTVLSAPNYSAKGLIEVGPGVFYLSRTLNIEHQIVLRGCASPMGNNWGACSLKFPTGVTGIRIHSAQTSTSGKDAAGTLIEGMTIKTTRGGAASEGGYHGVHASTRFVMRDCVVALFGDTGVNIVATNGVSGNANNWRLDNCRLAENGFDGLYVDGDDANAGCATMVDCSSNLRWGIFDSSFLGNTYTACHVSANTAGGYKTEGLNNRSCFVGCYTEGGQTSEFTYPGMIVGGTWGVSDPTGTAPFLDAGDQAFRIKNANVELYKGIDFTFATRSTNTANLDAYLESTWTPTATNVTVTGTPTYSGTYTRVGNRVFFEIGITTTGTNAFTGNSTYVTLPSGLTPTVGGSCSAVATNTTSVGHCYISTTGRVYLPTWAASSQTVYISGNYPVSTTA